MVVVVVVLLYEGIMAKVVPLGRHDGKGIPIR